MPQDKPLSSVWSLAQRALACSKPRCRTLEQINVIAEMLTYLAIFEGVRREELLAVAYFLEAKHSEAGECVLSKGQPLEQWCLLLQGSALLTRYSAQRGSEQVSTPLRPSDSWSEAALLHTTHPRRSNVTVVAGPQGCMTLRLRYSDYDAMNDMRNSMQLLPPEGTQGPPVEVDPAQRRAASMALLCCFLRRMASARPADERTPEEASELEPFFASLPAYRAYTPELVASLAAACRCLSLPAGSMVYEYSTLADAHVTVLSGEVQLRRFGAQPGEEADGDGGGTATATTTGTGGTASTGSAGAAASGGGPMRPVPPPGQKPGATGVQPQDASAEGSGGRLNIRARLRREREARKLMQKQLDEYVSRLDANASEEDEDGPKSSSRPKPSIKDPSSASPIDWTRVFMQKAMRSVEPVWKALHPADKAPRRRQGANDGGFDIPLDGSEGPVTEVAQLLGPAAAKAYYRGLQSQGYSDTESSPSQSGSSTGGTRSGEGSGDAVARERWRRWMFTVDGPETEKQRNLRSMAMRASRINRERHARFGRGGFDAEEMDEMYGPQLASLTRGSAVGELSTIMLHSAMRKESAVAGPGGCELLLVDWEAYQQGVLAARAAVLGRAATFFSSLPKESLSQLAEMCLCLSVDAGTLLARQGAPLECMVVVQDGEVSLLHEPSAALHTRITTIRGLAVSRSRNGRPLLVPLLATLGAASAGLPGFGGSGGVGSAAAATAAGGGGGAASGGSTAPSAAPTVSGGSFTGGFFTGGSAIPVEITLQGLPLGEIGVGGILGEAVLGARSGGAGGGGGSVPSPSAASGHADPAQYGQGQGHGHGQGGGHGQAASDMQQLPTVAAEGPKWPATVLAARTSVLLVMPRSVLYMSEFDLVRGELMRFAAERRSWLARRVEAAYRSAAAPPTTPAVFAMAAGNAQPQPPPQPSPRRSAHPGSTGTGGGGGGAPNAVSAAAAASDGAATSPRPGSFPRRAVSGDVYSTSSQAAAGGGINGASDSGGPGGSGSQHFPLSRRRSVESLQQRSSSPNNPVAAAATPSNSTTVSGGTGILSRPNSKWDFLDGPTSATGAATAAAAAAAAGGGGGVGGCGGSTSLGTDMLSAVLTPLASASGSQTRGAGLGLSLLDSAGSMASMSAIALTTSSFTYGSGFGAGGGGGCAPLLRRPSSGNLRPLKDAAAAAGAPAAVIAPSLSGCSMNGVAGPDLSGLSPAQQALLEVGLDPYSAGPELSHGASAGVGASLERHGSAALASALSGGGCGGGGSGSSVTALPALTPSCAGTAVPPSRGLAPLVIGGSVVSGPSSGPVSVSPGTSADLDAMRTAGVAAASAGFAVPFRSPNALTPTNRRGGSHSGVPGVLPMATLPPQLLLLESGYGNGSMGGSGGGSGIALSASAQLVGFPVYPAAAAAAAATATAAPTTATRTPRAGTAPSGMAAGVRRRTDMDGGAAAGGTAAGGAAPTPAGGVLTASPPPPSLGSRVPALQALDALETVAATPPTTVPSSSGLFGRSSRMSYTGGVTPRMTSVDSSWLHALGRGGGGFPSGLRGRGPTRDGAAFDIGLMATATEAEVEEEALARSLVPKNQAGMFMVRGGVASTPTKQPAARRIAGCF